MTRGVENILCGVTIAVFMKTDCREIRYFVFVAGVLMALSGCDTVAHPSDAVLIERFYRHQADFEKLVTMLDQDRDLVRITAKNVFLEKGATRQVPKERHDEYRRLLELLQLNGGIQRDKDGLILIASLKGIIIPNSSKSYLYALTEPSPLVESLDHVVSNNRGDQRPVYKRISGNWYLDYESW
jgi:hypothetical protein